MSAQSGAGGASYVAHLSLGSNIGDRIGTLRRALEIVDRSPEIELIRISSHYRTEPVGYLEQPEFINCCATVRCELDPESLLTRLRDIESALGRTQRQRWHEREIDIDIVLAGDFVLVTDRLVLPHPEMHRRRFVLVPLAEIAPDARHPLLGATVAELLRTCTDTSSVQRVDDPDSLPFP